MIVEIVFAAWLVLALTDAEYRPRKSGIIYAIGAFLLIIGLADLFGMEPWKSFWSNFERMEGFVTLLHLGAFFLVISSVFSDKHWNNWWNTTLVASFFMVIYCSFQLAGVLTINQGGARVDGTLGNASYLAVYMLLHIFIALLMWWRKASLKWVYGILIMLEVWILYSTATRGAILGLIGGALITAILSLRSTYPRVRQASIGIILAMLVVVGGFFVLKDTSFVQNSPVLVRFASISTEELKSGGRSFVWPMAWQGIKERPLLGWGQDNFNYVFNEHYSPEMYKLEPWFDRAHNIFLDWGISGGLLGLLSYLSLYIVLLWLVFKSDMAKEEKAIITGMMAAYFFHNFFVFDQLVSYIFFFAILGYVHARYARTEKTPALWQKNLPWGATLGAAALVLAFSFYFVNWQPLRANLSLITTLKNIGGADANKQIAGDALIKAYSLSRLGRPETVEQISVHTLPILSSGLPNEYKNAFYNFAKSAVLDQTAEFEKDARYEIVAAAFLAQTGSMSEAAEHYEKARALIPGKQLVYFEYGNLLLNSGDKQGALAVFKQAYDLAPGYEEAQIIYLVGAIYAGDRQLEENLIETIGERKAYFDDRVASAYYSSGRKSDLISLLNKRKQMDPQNAATYDQYIQQVNSQ
jgi:O-antigen ligase